MPKRFIIYTIKKYDNDLPGYKLVFEELEKEVIDRKSKTKEYFSHIVSSDDEKELREKIRKVGLKPNKWFTSIETSLSAKQCKSKLGFTLLAKLRRQYS